MNLESKQTIHLGVNFIVAPIVTISVSMYLKLLEKLSTRQIEFSKTQRTDKEITLTSEGPEHLMVQIKVIGPQVSQFLILSPKPTSIDIFVRNADLICTSFVEVWPGIQQVISRDCTIRHLYQTDDAHAFKFLWENRLKQSGDDFNEFNRPVLGGGLRLVMPPNDQNRTQIQLKIESYLRDSRMLFVETQFAWPYPLSIREGLKPKDLVDEIDDFATEVVPRFIFKGI